jgi:hypothetical protein
VTGTGGLLDKPIPLEALQEACRLYDRRYGRYDLTRDAFRRSLARLAGTSTRVVLGNEEKFGVAIVLLNAWGCRLPNALRPSCSSRALERSARMLAGLTSWWLDHSGALPVGEDLSMSTMLDGREATRRFTAAFEGLRAVRVADEPTYRRSFSDVATSKVLYLVSPSFCMPWDRAIKRRCHITRGTADAYVTFLSMARQRLDELRAEDEGFERRLVEPSGYLPTQVEALNKYLFVTSR